MKVLFFILLAQTAFAFTRPVVEISRIHQAPQIEDFLDMDSDSERDLLKIEGFRQRERNDNKPSTRLTRVFLGYDDRNFYAVFQCFEKDRDKIRARMMNRGSNAIYNDDIVTVQLDTFNDQRRAYQFVSNPFGVQQDAVWFEDSATFDYSFDTVFKTKARITQDGYVVLFAIPFRSLRFSSDERQNWGILLTRYIPGIDEQTYWPQYSNKISGRLNQTAVLNGLRNISPGRNIQLLPYTAFRSFQALDLRNLSTPRIVEDPAENEVGIDGKFIARDSLVVDVTANPDFSHVESDEPQVTVNQRFEVLFPEKRPFFLENQSFFETPINLLFTRRIADPQWGTRLTGKIGNYSLGALLSDDESEGKSLPEDHPLSGERAYYGTIRVSRDLGHQSSIGLIYADSRFASSFNRAGGVDAHIKFSDQWVSTFQAVTTSTRNQDGTRSAGPGYRVNLRRNGRHFVYNFDYHDFSPGFVSRTGFVNRTDIRRFDQQAGYSFRPESNFLFAWTPHYDISYVYDHSGTLIDWFHNPWVSLDMAGQTFLGFGYTFLATRVKPDDFPVLTENLRISRHEWGVTFNTEALRRLSVASSLFVGRSVNFVPREDKPPAGADFLNAALTLSFRPTNSFTIDTAYILNRLTDPQTSFDIFNNHIIRTKWNYQINRELSIRVIVQYDTLLANTNFTRLQTVKNLNADLLVTYMVHPGTALFVGFNSNLQNLDPSLAMTGSGLLRTRNDFLNDGKQFFVKYSHLFRF
ncbi:carbohydrate binding family 9 domain-containing protein [bacterium]|nr:carbohydrate binding family 9 domain-containing protein [bacterium]